MVYESRASFLARCHADPDAIVFWSCMFLSMIVWPIA